MRDGQARSKSTGCRKIWGSSQGGGLIMMIHSRIDGEQ